MHQRMIMRQLLGCPGFGLDRLFCIEADTTERLDVLYGQGKTSPVAGTHARERGGERERDREKERERERQTEKGKGRWRERERAREKE